jgi:hypothetical protein
VNPNSHIKNQNHSSHMVVLHEHFHHNVTIRPPDKLKKIKRFIDSILCLHLMSSLMQCHLHSPFTHTASLAFVPGHDKETSIHRHSSRESREMIRF